MVQTTWAWNNAFNKRIVPESFVEITLGVVDTKATQNVEITQSNNHRSSNTSALVRGNETVIPANLATFEENRWVLDGSKVVSDNDDVIGTGFVGSMSSESSDGYWWIQFDLPEDTTTVASGITIVWDSEHGEYPTSFSIGFATEKNTVTRHVVTIENNEIVSQTIGQDMEIEVESLDTSVPHITRLFGKFTGYNMVHISINKWNTPNHYPRMDRFIFGRAWTFGKNEIMSYSHEQSGDILGAELPKNSITFSVDNTDDKWNPNNPNGLGKYITERQMVTVRYGVDTGQRAVADLGTIHWIPGGTFYLSEWDTPSNGLEATFTARDPLEFIMNTKYPGLDESTHMGLIETSLAMSEFPHEIEMNLDPTHNHDCLIPEESVDVNAGEFGLSTYSVADVIQLCVNASGSVFWFDRNGVFNVKGIAKFKNIEKVYDIPMDLAYSHPEIAITKPVRFVEFDYNPVYDNTSGFVRYYVDDEKIKEGETVTFKNDFIQSQSSCLSAAAAVRSVLKHRKQATGEFRANPCLDLFDWVNIHSKYGEMKMIVTRIKYTYSGAFHAEYTAREMEYVEEDE